MDHNRQARPRPAGVKNTAHNAARGVADNKSNADKGLQAALKRPAAWIALTAVVAVVAVAVAYILHERHSVQPESGIDGYYSMSQTVMHDGVDGAVLRDIYVAQDGDTTEVHIAFAGAVPEYSVWAQQDPARVAVDLMRLGEWPASIAISGGKSEALLGMFRNYAAGEGVTELVFQMKRSVGYRVDIEGSELVLRLRSVDQPAAAGYYATLGAYEAYCEGVFELSGLSPALCADGASVTLISRRYDTSVEAESFAADIDAKLIDILPSINAQVVQLSGNEAPPLSDAAERAALSARQVYTGGGSYQLWTINGRLLSWMPDKKRALFARRLSLDSEYYELWLYDLNGKGQRLIDMEFQTIRSAAFSPDGGMVAFAEDREDGAALYCYALTTRRLESLSETVGNVYGYEFDDQNRLFLTGGVDYTQLIIWNVADGDDAYIQVIDVSADITGALALGSDDWAPNTVFMSDGNNLVTEYNYETGAVGYITGGASIRMSPGGRYLMLLEYSGETDGYTGVAIYNLTERRTTQAVTGVSIAAACWSGDGAGVCYLTFNDDEATADEYPTVLHKYDISTGGDEALGLMAGYNINTGGTDDELILDVPYRNADGRGLTADYRVNLQ